MTEPGSEPATRSAAQSSTWFAVKTGRPPHNSLSDSVKTMQLVERIYVSKME